MNKLLRELFFVVFSSIFIVVLLTISSNLMLQGHPFYYSKMEHQDYINISEFPFYSGNAPFVWRILLPAIVHYIPFPKYYSFFCISVSALISTAVLIYFILKKSGFDKEYSFYGLILFLSLVWAVRFNIIEFWYPDSLLIFFICLTVYAIITRKKLLFVFALSIGVTVKETMIITIPLYYFLSDINNSNNRLRILYENIILALPALLIFIILRFSISPTNNYNILNDLYGFTKYRIEAVLGIVSSLNYEVVNNQPQWLTAAINIYRLSFGAFSGLLFIILLNPKSNKKILSHYGIFIILVYLQIFIAYDSERLLVLCFIPIILMSVEVLKYFQKNNLLKKNVIRIFIMLLFSIQLFTFQSYYYETYYAVFSQNILCFLLFIYMMVVKRWRLNNEMKFAKRDFTINLWLNSKENSL